MMPRADFASDNTAAVAPEALRALIDANTGPMPSYGEDPITARAADLVRQMLDADAEVHFVGSGTGANGICLGALCRPFEAVLAHEHAHVAISETGAPGFFGGGLSVIGLPGPSGCIDPEALKSALAQADSPHFPPPAALSLTNVTEYGALYSVEETRALTAMAKAAGLGVHLDGARLAMAAAAGFDLKAIKALDVDLLVIGGTKAGMTPTEAIVIFDGTLARRFGARLKHAGQLPSKARFLAAPWIGMLESGAFIERAAHANAMARKLAQQQPFELLHPVDSNGVFVRMDAAAQERVHAAGWELHAFADGSVRLMTTWATTDAQIEEVVEMLRSVR
ncbi:MAG TPA: beta-eliminating lyase-related protein [Caulobacteraceae bacterium]|jgi:threonine aldolase|nr:beta-eliminating lyase-related protein [Caulobacteraceae bacterium]